MSISGLIILLVLLALSLYSILSNDGLRSYTIRNTVGIYNIVLGILAITRINRCGIIAVYIGVLTVVMSAISLYLYKKDYNKCRILLVLSLILGTIGTYLSYYE